ncbi:molybdenum cofactor biosynthesis protein MoaE [Sphingomonas sp. LY160]|uniref:molybdenum cofactor biosynthesis protein MoaE n=1 Tax=Sphingomonas sp. LY160 TaxID=3095342 RepID=UPI002ADEB5E1|nr:molybdenum cofactor biosynthesis protein MoaE [Sphingomonas sp. LY160]MEA1072285.1 molybdenum cofactor biosynthesis protein MoaE [Sphingomonas sp. LY160]
MMPIVARLEPGPLKPDAELAAFLDNLDGEGAVVTFVGVARPTARDGQSVNGLFLDHYPGMTETTLRDIASACAAKHGDLAIRVAHRSGHVVPGEPIVFTAVAATHRGAAFDAASELMDRLKSEAAFWKREDRADGSVWIEPSAEDRAALEKWSDNARDR